MLATELYRIHTGSFSHLIHEGFDKDRVLVNIHTTPETWRDMRIAHRMIDRHIREAVSNTMFTTRLKTLEAQWIFTFIGSHYRRANGRQNRLA